MAYRYLERYYMEIITLASILALGWKILDWFKYLTNKQWRPAVTQLAAWVIMIIGITLFAHSDFSNTTVIGDVPIKSLNGASLLLLGTMYGSLAGVGVSVIRAFDNSDSAKTPSLIPEP